MHHWLRGMDAPGWKHITSNTTTSVNVCKCYNPNTYVCNISCNILTVCTQYLALLHSHNPHMPR